MATRHDNTADNERDDAPSTNRRASRRRTGESRPAASSGSAARQNPSLIPASIDPAASGMGWKIAYTVHEIPAVTGVPLKTVKREASDGHLVSASFNGKVEVYLTEDIVDWLRRRRSIPASTETREILKKKRTRRAARPAAVPPETEESQRRRAKYHDIKRRLERE